MNMANLAINQLPTAANRTDGDYFYIVRAGVDLKLNSTFLAPQTQTASIIIAAADVLTLNATPVEIIAAPSPTQVIVPLRGLVQFSGGTVNYATNTSIMFVSSSDTANGVMFASIADRTKPNAFTTAAATVPAPSAPGDSFLVSVITGDPTAGDSDLTITIWYNLFTLS